MFSAAVRGAAMWPRYRHRFEFAAEIVVYIIFALEQINLLLASKVTLRTS